MQGGESEMVTLPPSAGESPVVERVFATYLGLRKRPRIWYQYGGSRLDKTADLVPARDMTRLRIQYQRPQMGRMLGTWYVLTCAPRYFLRWQRTFGTGTAYGCTGTSGVTQIDGRAPARRC
ncbi:hypothetical protein BD311DRAFT_81835 [Dichomitus squalens]|uniref:Uncharacterized protein n=1 Tax=Dichomitus squalens TaxID=114155 RepID=A0A4Q9MZD4_9APHY|nr:hypothetical protein BD311DRAFT_81835 [Dichomitus squalens]